MPYAEGRIFNDADSHIMETRDWLISHADPDIRPKLHPLAIGSGGRMVEKAIAHAADRHNDPAAAADAEQNLMLRKGWEALGAFDPDERRRALDLLGFNSQLVFTTFAITHFWGEFDQVRSTPEVLYGGTRAHNRAIADFCRGDKRLLAVGFVPLDIPELAEKEIDEAIRLGMRRDSSAFAAARQEVSEPSRLQRRVGAAAGRRRSVHAARWGRRPRDPARISQQRSPGDRLPRRRREYPLEGFHDDPRDAGNLSFDDGPRRHLRAVPAAARRMYRAGRDVDRAVAAPPRHLAGDVREVGKIPEPADEGVRLRAAQSALHAVSARAGGMDRRAGRAGAVHVLVGLPAYRGRAQSAQAFRAVDAESVGGRARRDSTRPTMRT